MPGIRGAGLLLLIGALLVGLFAEDPIGEFSAMEATGLLALGGLPAAGIALMLALSGLAGLALTRFAKRHLGGQTGDIAGAAQQVAEIAALIGLLTVLPA